MACEIKIESVSRVGSGSTARIYVIGSVQKCASDIEGSTVVVRLFCGRDNTEVGVRDAEVQASGFWSAEFRQVAERCDCGQPVRVTAECATDNSCADDFTGDLDCIECPLVGHPGDDVGNSTVTVQCNADGTANVTVSIGFINTTPNMAWAKLVPGTDATVISSPFTGFTPGSSDVITGVFQYATPSNPQSVVLVHTDDQANPIACPPFVIDIGPIEDCRRECPSVSQIDVQVGACERDPQDNFEKRRVTFTPTIVGPVPIAYNWDFGDGETLVGAGMPAAISHLYSGIPIFEPSLCITGPGDCQQTCLDVPISEFDGFEACACPSLNSISVSIGECVADPNGGGQKREVTLTPVIVGPPPTSHVWDFGDGTTDASVGAPSAKTHLYANAPTSAPELCISGPEPCPDQCAEASLDEFDNFQSCGGGGSGGGDESTGCGVMRIAIAVFMALAILAGLLAICVPPAATALAWIAFGSAIVSVILGVIYSIFCPSKPCKILLLLTGQATLAAGVAAIVLSGCCPWMIWAGLGLVSTGLGLLLLWRSKCNRSYCALAKEVVKVVGVLVLPVLAVLVGIPVIGTCFSGVALAWVSALFGPISAYAATC